MASVRFRTRLNVAGLLGSVFVTSVLVYFISDTLFPTARLSTGDYWRLGVYGLVVVFSLIASLVDLPHWVSVSETDLVMHVVQFRGVVPISGIRLIKRVDYGRGVLAMSQRRLEIFYGKLAIAVRPVDEEAFLAALTSRNPAIEVVDK